MASLIEDDLKRALVRNEISRVHEILASGKISGMNEDTIPEGATVMHFAAMLGYQECVQSLLTKTLSDLIINLPDESTQATPLMHAITCQERKIAKLLLLSNKCDLTLCDSYQQTALHIEAATASNTAELAYYLVHYGANLEARDTEGMTPWLRAVDANNATVAKFLYSQRCDTTCACAEGRTAMHIAAQHGHHDILQWLIRIGCQLNVVTSRGQTALMLSVMQRKPAHVTLATNQLLIKAGADINAQDYHGNTALLLATNNPAFIRRTNIMLLLAHGAEPDISNKDGLTPLWQAVYDGIHYGDRIRIVEALVATNCYLDTPCRGNLLFTSGLDSVYSYENAMTPFEVAIDSGFFSAARLLLLAGAAITPDMHYEMQCPEQMSRDFHWLHSLIRTPPELQYQCRLVIRAVLGRPIHAKVRRLPLPERIKHFLLLADLIADRPRVT